MELPGGKQVGACAVRVLPVCIVKVEHGAPQLAVVFLGNLTQIVAHTHLLEYPACTVGYSAQSSCIGLSQHSAKTLCAYDICKPAQILHRGHFGQMRTEHLGVVLYYGVGFTLPNGTSPSLVVREIVVTVLVNRHITELAVYDVSRRVCALHCVRHQRGAYE